MGIMFWLVLVVYVLGAAAMAALVWFGGPLVVLGDTRLFDPVWVRLLLIALIVVAVVGAIALGVMRRRKALAELAKSLSGEGAAEEETDGDAEVLQQKMQDALATLKRATGAKGDYLYDLPWYVIIGPPGAGKTTALVNAGLKFPLSRGQSPGAVAGLGGTRYCDWWFTEEAVLIDTAGRYTTQDSDQKGDRKSWHAFLSLLKDNRPKQPINGVIVCISLEDLMQLSPAEINAHADAIRARLIELHEKLKVDFPVYAVFTKADLVAGFMEYFGHLNEAGRKVVWGATFQTDDKTQNMVGEIPAEFDPLIERLNAEVMDRLQEEATPTARVQLFGFPSQMTAVKKPVVDFLNRIFEPTRYHSNATLRGFYFTSGTQQGTPIDQLIGALSRSFGAEQAASAAYSGYGKSFFLHDLIQNVIIGEAGWVSTNRSAVRRNLVLRGLGYAAILFTFLGAGAVWWTSFGRNSELITQAFASATGYRTLGEDIRNETLVKEADLAKVLRHLHHLRTMPAGFATRDEPVPVASGFGLSQWERLNSASESAYRAGLERHLRSRLLFRLEQLLRARITDAAYVYESLSIYLMLGLREPMDKAQVVAFFRRDWSEVFPGASNAEGRAALEAHLVAMLAFDPPTEAQAIALDSRLIGEAQRTLGRMGVADRAFEILKAQARAQAARDWVVKARGGQDVALVFDGTNGEDLDAVRVPFFFTRAGFHEALLPKLGEVRAQVERERRLMGDVADQAAIAGQFETLEQAVLERYNREFVAAWQQTLRRLRIRSLTADRPRYVALDAAARATSPIPALLQSIRDETALTREAPRPAGAAAAPAGAAPVRLASGEVPGAAIEAIFRPFHVLVEGDGGKRPVDELIKNLSDIHQSLAAMADPAQTTAANQAFRAHLQSLRGTATRFPPPFSTMLQTAANSFDGDATGTTVARLSQMLSDQVTRTCTELTQGRYPFTRGSPTDMPIQDMQRLFATNGIIDRFFAANLAPLADTSGREWRWNATNPVARQLPPALIRDFQRAAQVRETFLPSGAVGFSFVVKNLAIPPGIEAARLEINSGVLLTEAPPPPPPPPLGGLFGAPPPPPPPRPAAPAAPVAFQWPGPAGLARAALIYNLDKTGRTATLERQGPWALFRLLEAAKVQRSGEALIADLSIGGQTASYQINVVSPLNPLVSPLLREFRCPSM